MAEFLSLNDYMLRKKTGIPGCLKTQPAPVKSKCPDLSGHLLFRFRIMKKGFSAHQPHHLLHTQHVYGSFQVVRLYRKCHLRSPLLSALSVSTVPLGQW